MDSEKSSVIRPISTHIKRDQDKRITVSGILDFVKKHNLHLYNFSDEGSGCFFWNRVLFALLEKDGFVRPGCDDHFKAMAEQTKHKHPFPKWRGTFQIVDARGNETERADPVQLPIIEP